MQASFIDPEVSVIVLLDYRAGHIVKSKTSERVLDLLQNYAGCFLADFIVAQEKVTKLH